MIRSHIKALALGTLLISTLAGSSVAMAQDDAVVGPSHPAHIHVGDCANADPNPLAMLNNVEPRLNDDEDDNAPQGTLTASLVTYSMTDDIDLNFKDDVLATAHSIIVHESDANIQNYIACGDIGGVMVDGEMLVALHPLNDSGYTGIAKLTTDGDGQVDVQIFLAEPAGDMGPDATPAA